MWKTYGSNTRHTTHTTRTFHCNHAKILQHSHLLQRGGVCGIYTNIVVTQRCFCPRKPVANKQPTCVESEREVNKVNGRLTETVRCQHTHRASPVLHLVVYEGALAREHPLTPPEWLRRLLRPRACAGAPSALLLRTWILHRLRTSHPSSSPRP